MPHPSATVVLAHPGALRRALRAKAASVAYGVGESTLWKLASEGKLKPVRLGPRCTLFPVDQLEALFVAPANTEA